MIAGGVTAGLGAAGYMGIGAGGMTVAALPKVIDGKLEEMNKQLDRVQISQGLEEKYRNMIQGYEDRLENIDFIKGNPHANMKELVDLYKDIENYNKNFLQ